MIGSPAFSWSAVCLNEAQVLFNQSPAHTTWFTKAFYIHLLTRVALWNAHAALCVRTGPDTTASINNISEVVSLICLEICFNLIFISNHVWKMCSAHCVTHCWFFILMCPTYRWPFHCSDRTNNDCGGQWLCWRKQATFNYEEDVRRCCSKTAPGSAWTDPRTAHENQDYLKVHTCSTCCFSTTKTRTHKVSRGVLPLFYISFSLC